MKKTGFMLFGFLLMVVFMGCSTIGTVNDFLQDTNSVLSGDFEAVVEGDFVVEEITLSLSEEDLPDMNNFIKEVADNKTIYDALKAAFTSRIIIRSETTIVPEIAKTVRKVDLEKARQSIDTLKILTKDKFGNTVNLYILTTEFDGKTLFIKGNSI